MNNDIREVELQKYSIWFYAAAIYNFIWGVITILFPAFLFDLIGAPPPKYLPLWQVVGMFVLVYAPAYWWVARRPGYHRHLIVIALMGKVFGPIGFVWAAFQGQFPLAFGWTIITNDLIWWPAFALYLRDVIRLYGGVKPLMLGD